MSKVSRIKEESGEDTEQETEPNSEKRETDIERVILQTRNNIKEILICTNATPIRSKIGLDYACCFCPERFTDPAELKQHSCNEHFKNLDKMDPRVAERTLRKLIIRKSRLTVKLDITSLTCKLCDAPINDIEELFQHLTETHKRMVHTNIKNHIVPFKFESEQPSCCICFREFTSFKSVVEHMNTHTTNYTCEICSATFIALDRLKSHMKLNHAFGKFKCNFCPKFFNTKLKVYHHERGVHKKADKINKCEFCVEVFATRWEKQKHKFKVHGIKLPIFKKVTCESCSREFPNIGAYNTHFRRFHLMERSHKCEYCEMRFFDLRELQKHVVKHTGEKNYRCDVCLKAFGRQKTLREHLRIHADDRRFKCEHCEQSFVQKCTWKGHMRAKHGKNV